MKRRKRKQKYSAYLFSTAVAVWSRLLLFVLTVGKKSDTMVDIKAKTEEIIGQMENDIADKDSELKSLQRSLTTIRERNRYATEQIEEKKKMQTELEDELALLLAQLASMEEDLGKLLEDKENMPMQEEEAPIPIPNAVRRQYLTGFDIQGDHVLFLIEALAYDGRCHEEAVKRQADSDEEKKFSQVSASRKA